MTAAQRLAELDDGALLDALAQALAVPGADPVVVDEEWLAPVIPLDSMAARRRRARLVIAVAAALALLAGIGALLRGENGGGAVRTTVPVADQPDATAVPSINPSPTTATPAPPGSTQQTTATTPIQTTTTVDDHGGSSGSDDDPPGDDSGGNRGSGSSNSGSGSDNSGSDDSISE